MEKFLTAALPWVLMALAAVLCAVQTAREDAMDNSLGVGLCAGMALGLVLSLVLRWDLGLCLAAGTLLGSGAALGLSETAETPPEPSHDLPAVSGEPVWLERLDGLGPREELALEKLRQDAPAFRRPSAPSRIAFVLSETAPSAGPPLSAQVPRKSTPSRPCWPTVPWSWPSSMTPKRPKPG